MRAVSSRLSSHIAIPMNSFFFLRLHLSIAAVVTAVTALLLPLCHYIMFSNEQFASSMSLVSIVILLPLFVVPAIHALIWFLNVRQQTQGEASGVAGRVRDQNLKHFIAGAILTSSLLVFLTVAWGLLFNFYSGSTAYVFERDPFAIVIWASVLAGFSLPPAVAVQLLAIIIYFVVGHWLERPYAVGRIGTKELTTTLYTALYVGVVFSSVLLTWVLIGMYIFFFIPNMHYGWRPY